MQTIGFELEIITMTCETCCPVFNPEPWENKEITLKNERFITRRVRCLFFIPINFGPAIKKQVDLLEKHDAIPAEFMLLSNNCSLWGMDVHVNTSKEIPNVKMTTISGDFLSKVFEGCYKETGKWVKEMKKYVASTGKEMKDLYFSYTTCPKCAKKYGKNYVVLLAKI
jgi:hypothetical protein